MAGDPLPFVESFAEQQELYAKAKGEAEELYELRKLVHAAAQNAGTGSEAQRTREASENERYKELTNQYVAANKTALLALASCKSLECAFEAWRTKSANARREGEKI
jgi:hypothetical protein